MKIKIEEHSIVHLAALSGGAQNDLSDFVRAIEAAPSIASLYSLLPDDFVVTNDNGFYILVKESYQYVRMCIRGKVNITGEATLVFEPYE